MEKTRNERDPLPWFGQMEKSVKWKENSFENIATTWSLRSKSLSEICLIYDDRKIGRIEPSKSIGQIEFLLLFRDVLSYRFLLIEFSSIERWAFMELLHDLRLHDWILRIRFKLKLLSFSVRKLSKFGVELKNLGTSIISHEMFIIYSDFKTYNKTPNTIS